MHKQGYVFTFWLCTLCILGYFAIFRCFSSLWDFVYVYSHTVYSRSSTVSAFFSFSLWTPGMSYLDCSNMSFSLWTPAVWFQLLNNFMRKWKCWDLSETTEFLHMCIKHHDRKINIDQHTYLDKVIECFGLQNANSTPTSLSQEYYSICNNGLVNLALYTKFQTIIGSLLYIMISTWPDIAYAVMALSKYSANATKKHVSKVLYICCYLLGTPDTVLCFDSDQDQGIIVLTDTDWTSDLNNCKSQTGWFLKLAGWTFSWHSHQ